MIKLGIDAINIDRFNGWHTYSNTKLARIFSQSEIAYSLSNQLLAPQRLAVRFAAKEAFFKALSPLLDHSIPFLAACRLCQVTMTAQGIPVLEVQWPALPLNGAYHAELSLTHSDTIAIAIVLIHRA